MEIAREGQLELRRHELLGPPQQWMSSLRDAVANGVVHDVSDRDEDAFKDQSTWIREADLRPGAPTLSAREATHVVAKALVGVTESRTALTSVAEHVRRSGLTSIGEVIPSGAPPVSSVVGLRAVAAEATTTGHGLPLLLALDLAGVMPATARSVRVSVLFDHHRNRGGTAGSLSVSQLKTGPSGLHPDPRTMMFTQISDATLRSLESAWSESPLSSSNSSFVWSVTAGGGETSMQIHGGSMAAAMALALDDLASRRRPAGRLRREIDPFCAITAGLEQDRLVGVEGYGSKLEAARESELRVVVAEEDYEAALRAAPVDFDQVEGAATLAEAIALTRTRVSRTLLATIAFTLCVAIASVTAWWAASVIQDRALEEQQRIRASAQLAAAATDLAETDSRKAALYALASQKLHSTIDTYKAVEDVVQANRSVLASVAANDGAIGVVASATHVVSVQLGELSSDVWSLPDLEPLGSLEIDGPVAALSEKDGKFIVADDSGVKVFQSSTGRLPRLAQAYPLDRDWSDSSILPPLYFASSGTVVLLDDALHGRVLRVGEEDVEFDLSGAGALGRNDPFLPTIRVAKVAYAADATEVEAGLFDHTELLLGMQSGQVASIRFETDPDNRDSLKATLKEIVAQAPDRGPVKDLQVRGDALYLATDRGIEQIRDFREAGSASTTQQYGGLPGSVDALVLLDDDETFVAATSRGLYSVEADGYTPISARQSAAPGAIASLASAGSYSDQVVVGRDDGTLSLIAPEINLRATELPASPVSEFTPQGRTLLVDLYDRRSANRATGITARAPDGSVQATYALPAKDGYPYVQDVAATQDWVSASGMDGTGRGTVWLWNAATRELDATYQLESDAEIDIVYDVVLDEVRGKVFAYNPGSATLGRWDIESGKQRTLVIELPVDERRVANSFSADATRSTAVIPGAHNNEAAIHVVDLDAMAVDHTLPVGGDVPGYLSPDGSTYFELKEAVGSMYRVTDGKEVATRKFAAVGTNADWRPDGKMIAVVTNQDGRVLLLDPRTLADAAPAFIDVQGRLPGLVDYSPSGKQIAVNYVTQPRPPYSVPDATLVVDVQSRAWERELCGIAGSGFTEAEWHEGPGADLPKPALCEY